MLAALAWRRWTAAFYALVSEMILPADKMSEAEVSLRLSFGLIASGQVRSDIEVAIDGAQVRTGSTIHFPIVEFLEVSGWERDNSTHGWRGIWKHGESNVNLIIHSGSGRGDVVAKISSQRTLRVEAKKGSLQRSKSSAEYPLMREAMGQLLTVEEASESDALAIAVPSSEKFDQLAVLWRSRPLVRKCGIAIATVNRKNEISGLEHLGV